MSKRKEKNIEIGNRLKNMLLSRYTNLNQAAKALDLKFASLDPYIKGKKGIGFETIARLTSKGFTREDIDYIIHGDNNGSPVIARDGGQVTSKSKISSTGKTEINSQSKTNLLDDLDKLKDEIENLKKDLRQKMNYIDRLEKENSELKEKLSKGEPH